MWEKNKIRNIFVALFVFSALVTFSSPAIAKVQFLAISAGSSGGSFYPVCTTFATVLNKELQESTGYKFSVQSSVGTADNLERIRKKEVGMAIADAVVASQAFSGTGNYVGKAITNQRFITALYSQANTIVVRKGIGIEKLSDFKGKKFAVGAAGGAEATVIPIIFKQVAGMTYGDFEPQYLGDSHASQALQDRLVDGAVLCGGVPVASVSEVFASQTPVAILNFTDEDIAKVQEVAPWYVGVKIPAGTYTGQDVEAQAVGAVVAFVVEKDVDADLVYKILEVTYKKSLEEIKTGYSTLGNLSLDRAIVGLSNAPLHPGAVKFYRDNGIDVPENLIPPEMK